jgi:hypothetical protein
MSEVHFVICQCYDVPADSLHGFTSLPISHTPFLFVAIYRVCLIKAQLGLALNHIISLSFINSVS